jgi:hypothetical protein
VLKQPVPGDEMCLEQGSLIIQDISANLQTYALVCVCMCHDQRRGVRATHARRC